MIEGNKTIQRDWSTTHIRRRKHAGNQRKLALTDVHHLQPRNVAAFQKDESALHRPDGRVWVDTGPVDYPRANALTTYQHTINVPK